MRILFLSFYYEPDLCAGSFRNTPLVKKIEESLSDNDEIIVITSQPNRYKSYKVEAPEYEDLGKVKIHRINITAHNSGMKDQAKSFYHYYKNALVIAKSYSFDMVYASSSRLFTAYLGSKIAKKNKVPYYVDVRDIFVDTMNNLLQNVFVRLSVIPFLKYIENKTFKRATHINLISEGFHTYFKNKFDKPTYSFFSHGIDDVFINNIQNVIPENNNQLKTIVYAGNIGEGQGLHKIIPQVAPRLFKHNYLFKIIGDGGKREELRKAIENNEICNVELIDPVDRSELIKKYKDADFLFLHLNDYQAFERVLPSKLFEYATFPVPIIAGVGGYASRFIKEELTNYVLFEPNDGDGLVNQLENFKYNKEHRESFIQKYERETINKKMAQSILSYLND